MTTIAFQTSCYENSYPLLLKDGLLDTYLNCFKHIDFSEKFIILNNINDEEKVINLLNKYPDFKWYDSYNESVKVLPHFGLIPSDFPYGVYYSIQHFIGLYYTKSDYLIHISEDCNIDNLNSQFILDSIDILESNDDYICALPRWMKDPELGAKEEAQKEDGKFYIAQGFSDQVNIYKTKIFKQDIYHFEHPDSNRFPPKGGNSFERRVNSYLKVKNKFRAIHKDYYYIHGYYDPVYKGV